MATEEAEYAVLRQEGNFELRDYAPHIVAEIVVEGDFADAGSKAFRPLFKYISGDNTAQARIAMTAPVAQTAKSQKIAMTSPVGQRATEGGWVVSFMMPAEFTMDTLPTPDNPAVTLRAIEGHRMAAVRYSGRWTETNYQTRLRELRNWAEQQGLPVIGEPVFARYNAPFTPWFMRRNEILLPVAR